MNKIEFIFRRGNLVKRFDNFYEYIIWVELYLSDIDLIDIDELTRYLYDFVMSTDGVNLIDFVSNVAYYMGHEDLSLEDIRSGEVDLVEFAW